MLLLSVD